MAVDAARPPGEDNGGSSARVMGAAARTIGDEVSNVKPVTHHAVRRDVSGGTRGAPLNSSTRTVLGRMMAERGMRVSQISALLGCSDRQTFYVLARKIRVPMVNFAGVCSHLDADQEDLVDQHGYLRLDAEYDAEAFPARADDDGWDGW